MITLRAIEPEDLELVYALENDTATRTQTLSGTPISRYAVRRYLEESHSDLFADGEVRLVVEEEGRALGLVDLTSFDPVHSRAEVSIALLPKYRGQGYGLQALTTLADMARSLRMHQLYAFVSEDNKASNSLFGRAGFTLTACLTDWVKQDDTHYLTAHLWQKVL